MGEDARGYAHSWRDAVRGALRPDGSWLLLFCAIVLLSFLARLDAIEKKQCLERDEGTSYLAAAAKQGAYTRKSPANHWVPAHEWKAYHRIDEPLALRTIQRDLVEYDLHPPLYFWSLHAAGLAAPLRPATGGFVNLLFHVTAMVCLFLLARFIAGSGVVACVVVGLWSFSPPVIATTLLVRQYELLAFLVVASLLVLSRIMEHGPIRPLRVLSFVLVVLLALLTHYQALLLLPTLLAVALAAWVMPAAGRRNTKGLLAASAAIVGACLLYALVHPDVFSEIGSELGGQGQATQAAFAIRWPRVVETLGRFVPLSDASAVAPWGIALLVAGSAILACAWRLSARLRDRPAACAARLHLLYAALPLAMLGGAIIAQYLLARSPQHAMGDRYLAIVWPLLALSLSWPLALIVHSRLAAVAAVGAMLVWADSGAATRLQPVLQSCTPVAMKLAAHYDAVIVDSTRRGRLPQLFPHLRAESSVFAAHGDDLLANREALLEGLEDHTDALVFHLRGQGVRKTLRGEMMSLFQAAGWHIGAPDDPSSLLARESVLLLVAAGPDADWPPDFVQALKQRGASLAGVESGGPHAVAVMGERIMGEAGGAREEARLVVRIAGVNVEAEAHPDGAVSIRLNGRAKAWGRGLAVVAYDIERDAVLWHRVFRGGHPWAAMGVAFRIWR